ncbi:hypothetical protein ACFE04_016833 [Oxalis oulophora]
MSSTSLEVTMLSAEDLRIERRPVKKNTYAIVRTENFNECATKLDQDGGSNPSWNQKLVIDLPRHAQFLTIDVYCKPSSTTSGKLVGTAKIPVSDFMGGYVPPNCLHCLSYRLKDPRGDKNGIVNILVTVKLENINSGQINGYSTTTASGSALGIPAAAAGGGTSYGVVTGVPIWCGSYK